MWHSLYQPAWRQDRYQATCRACQARLHRPTRDRVLSFVLPVVAASVVLGVLPMLPREYRAYRWVALVVAVSIALIVHYYMASYQLLDSEADVLPDARDVRR